MLRNVKRAMKEAPLPLIHAPRQAARAFLTGDAPDVQVLRLADSAEAGRMRAEVLEGLQAAPQRWISPTYLYDDEGSAIYEAITELPEYYPTRTEAAMLAEFAPRIAERTAARKVLELGSGSSTKTRTILRALLEGGAPLTYIPVDVSEGMLEQSALALKDELPGLRVLGLAGRYEDAFETLEPQRDLLAIFLGGTIGNFPPDYQEAFFAGLGRILAPGSRFLLGFDRQAHAGKPPAVIQAAYDDEQGVTAQFNLNVLAHLNRALGADFKLGAWRHVARYDEAKHQIEMYLESATEQVVTFPDGPAIRFEAHERILTEISRKFDPDALAAWFEARGFRAIERFNDARDYFGLLLLERK